MRRLISISLLLYYTAFFMGYGAFSIIHDIFHAIPNMIHQHHVHGHHHVGDHHHTLQQLKKTENDNSPIHSPLKIIYLLNYLVADGHFEPKSFSLHQIDISGYHNFSKTYQHAPPTPPPISKS